MTDDFDSEIRSTLAVMVAEAPDPLSFDDLDRQTATLTASRTRWRPGKAFSVAFAAVLIAIGGIALLLSPLDGGVGPAAEVPATATTPPPEAPSSSSWSRIPHDADVFGEARMLSVVAGGPGFVAVGWTGTIDADGLDAYAVDADSFDAYAVDGDAAVWTSVDGITWEPSRDHGAAFADGYMASVTVGGPGLVAVGHVDGGKVSEPAIWTSPDGITWTRMPLEFASAADAIMHDVSVGGPGLVAIGADRSGPVVWTSVDGATWARVPNDPAVFGDDGDLSMSGVTAGGPGLVAVGMDWSGGTANAAIWTSVDGIVWERVPHDEDLFGGVGNPAAFSVAVVGTRVVAVGVVRYSDTDAAIWTSEDGIVWEAVPYDQEALVEGGMWKIAAGGPGLVSVGWIGRVAGQNSDAAVRTSVDGDIWDRVPHDENLFGGVEMWSVASGGPGLVAVGSDGPDAAVWISKLDD
jgi:hypothetical protein